MSVTGTMKNLEACTDALTKAGIIGMGLPATAEELQNARRQLNRLLKSWQNKGYSVWTITRMSVSMTTAREYTLDPVRPLQIMSCRMKRDGIERQLERLTADEYDRLPAKDAAGVPTTFYYDRQRESARLYVWPVLSVASGETLELTYVREIADVVDTDEVDVPGEWYDALVYNLASRLCDDYSIVNPQLFARAEALLQEALAFDREGSIWFGEVVD